MHEHHRANQFADSLLSAESAGNSAACGSIVRFFDTAWEWQTQPSYCVYGRGAGAQYRQGTWQPE